MPTPYQGIHIWLLLLAHIDVWIVLIQVWEHLPDQREAFLKAEQAFFDEVTQVSGKLFPFPKDERKAQAVKILQGIQVPRKVSCQTCLACHN